MRQSFCPLISAGAALLLAGCATTSPMLAAVDVPASVETKPVGTLNEDAADDPAIWRNAADPAKSLIVGTDKKAGLYVYGLDGEVKSFSPAGLLNNVDLVGGADSALVIASDRTDAAQSHLALFALTFADPTPRAISRVASGPGEGYGICLAQPGAAPTAGLPATVTAYAALKDGTVNRVDLVRNASGGYDGGIVSSAKIATQIEGCVVDPASGDLFIGEENAGIWRFANGDLSLAPERFAAIGEADGLVADVEGLAIAREDGRSLLIASSQGDNAYAVYAMDGSLLGRFRIAGGAIDATSETDGIEVHVGDFGPAFPGGLFIAQDGDNAPEAQNFKFVSWDAIKAALGL